MSFIAHSAKDIQEMLNAIGCNNIEDLFAEIDSKIQVDHIAGFSARMTEMQVWQLLHKRLSKDRIKLNFIGAGCYEHYVPAAVTDIISRGEFLTSYTPYQAEASQGTLQVLYEYQSMMARLTGLDVANASLYDGATALAEAILMAIRCHKHPTNKKILLPYSIHPFYRQVVKTIVAPQQVELIDVPFDLSTGQIDQKFLANFKPNSFVALVLPQPNFFGLLEEVDQLTAWAQEQQAFVIGLVNPITLGLLQPPGHWAKSGVDIACGEGQSLGLPLASGGPYAGFICCKRSLIRQLPGRLVGMTVDRSGKLGFTLTLQAREQHIRRAKATSNICTNQGLLATASTIYLSLMGDEGLKQVILQSHANALYLRQSLEAAGFELKFKSNFVHELVVNLNKPVSLVQDKLASLGIQAGFDLSKYYPELGNALLCCVTEVKTQDDIKHFVQELSKC